MIKSQHLNERMIVTVEGDVLSTSVDALREGFGKIFEAAQKGAEWKVLELDFTAAKMMDSAGLNLVTSVIKAAKARNAHIIAKIASKTVHRIFLFTRLDKHLELIMQED